MNTVSNPTAPFIRSSASQDQRPQVDSSEFNKIDSLSTSESSYPFFSSEAQFKFNLQSHAHKLEGEEKTNYVNFLKEHEYIDAETSDKLMAGEVKFEFSESEELKNRRAQINANFNSDKTYEPIIVSTVGAIDKSIDMVNRSSSHEAQKSNGWQELDKAFDSLKEQAFYELSEQDATVVSDYVERAVNNSKYYFSDTSALYDASFIYGEAKRIVGHTEMSQDLKSGFNNLIDKAVETQGGILSTVLVSAKEDYDAYPQYRKKIGEFIGKMEEIIPIFKKTVDGMGNDMSLVTDGGAGFKSLIKDTNLSNDLGNKLYFEKFIQHHENSVKLFDRVHIDKNWTLENVENKVNIDHTRQY